MFLYELVERFCDRLDGRVKRILAARAASGPYRYLVSNWSRVSDLDLAVKVLGSEFFKAELKPVPLPLERIPSVLVVAPHQDDETIGAGGTLLLLAREGCIIDILLITDGAQSGAGLSVEENVAIRNREFKEVCTHLGGRLHALGIPNRIEDLRPNPQDLARMAEVICELRPQVIMMPWVLDSPPKHRLVNHMLYMTNELYRLPSFEVWGYQTANVLYPNGYVDITSVAAEKEQLLNIYRSQNDYHYPCTHLGMSMCAWNSRLVPMTKRQKQARYAEVFFTLPSHDFFQLVQEFYLRDLWQVYRGNRHIIHVVSSLQSQVAKPESSLF